MTIIYFAWATMLLVAAEHSVEKDSEAAPIHKVGKPGDRRDALLLGVNLNNTKGL